MDFVKRLFGRSKQQEVKAAAVIEEIAAVIEEIKVITKEEKNYRSRTESCGSIGRISY